MKKYKSLLDIVLLIGLGMMALLAIAPDKFVMSTDLQMLLLAGVIVLLAGFMTLVWREDPADEREAQNQADASRYAYLIGVVVLMISLAYRSIKHYDTGIEPVALLMMIGTKLLTQRHRDK